MAGASATTKCPRLAAAERIPRARESIAKMKASTASASTAPNAPMMRDPKASPKPAPRRAPLAIDTRGYSSKIRTKPGKKKAIASRKGESLRVKKMGAVKRGTGGGRAGRAGPGGRPAAAPADPPGDEQSENSDRRAHQPAGLEQREWQKLGGE